MSRRGYRSRMSETPSEEHIHTRAELLAEERHAGSDDPEAQAEAILQESEERTNDPDGTVAESVQTSTPEQRPE